MLSIGELSTFVYKNCLEEVVKFCIKMLSTFLLSTFVWTSCQLFYVAMFIIQLLLTFQIDMSLTSFAQLLGILGSLSSCPILVPFYFYKLSLFKFSSLSLIPEGVIFYSSSNNIDL